MFFKKKSSKVDSSYIYRFRFFWEKIQANKAALLLAENLRSSGNKDKARETCNLLINANEEEDDAYVREAAERIISGL